MPRYFIEVSYKGTRYSGFQVQKNAVTIQSEVEKALEICFRKKIYLTGSSRTDAGVHALQNFFHFDSEGELIYHGNDISGEIKNPDKYLYSLNSILPLDIVVKNIKKLPENAHCRFDATTREYRYHIYKEKNPFYREIAWYYPYMLNLKKMQEASNIILYTCDFTSFSKKNTQVNTFICSINKSEWHIEKDLLIFSITGNRFLRGMVRGLVGTMLYVGTGKLSIPSFKSIIESKNNNRANFGVPAHGLFLVKVKYPYTV